jgi:hypothetical protein
MKNLASTILVSWLAFEMADFERNKKIPNKKKALLYTVLGCALWVLQIYEIFR